MNSKRHSLFYGWWVVLTAAVGLFWGPPITVYSFTVFLKPLMHDFHASRAAVSFGYTLHAIAVVISAPLGGWLIDRYGARKVMLPAMAMFGSILLSIRAFSASIWQFYFFYVALGLLGSGGGPIPYSKVVSLWFDRHRGLALGLMMLGIGSGAVIMPSLAQQLIARFGWRTAYAILGSGVLLIAIPVVGAFLREKPQDLGLLPDGAPSGDSTAAGEAATPGLSASDAWHSKTFWLMVSAFFLVSASAQGCLLHMVPMLTDRGITLQRATLGASLMGAAVLIGRVGTGYLLDRFFAPYLAAIFFGGAAAGIGVLWTGGATAVAFVGAFLVGLGLGAEVDIIAYLISRYFGLRFFGKIYGYAFGAFVLAGAVGPLLMGAGFDSTGSYRAPLATLFVSTLVATVLVTRLGPYRYHACQPNENQPMSAPPLGESLRGPRFSS
ncbi:MAG TPA: MFS transporter [Terriglobia bacterium]